MILKLFLPLLAYGGVVYCRNTYNAAEQCKRADFNNRNLLENYYVNLFYFCNNSLAELHRCPKNTYYFSLFEKCIELPNGKAYPDRLIFPTNDGSEFADHCKTCDDSPSKPPTYPPTGPPIDPPTGPPINPPTEPPTENPIYQCPDVDFPVNVPHPCGCRKYVICEKGAKRIAFCKKGQIYDIDRRLCNRAEDVKCPNKNPCDDDEISLKYDNFCSTRENGNYAPADDAYYDLFIQCREHKIFMYLCPSQPFPQYYLSDINACTTLPSTSDENWYKGTMLLPISDGSKYANRCRYCSIVEPPSEIPRAERSINVIEEDYDFLSDRDIPSYNATSNSSEYNISFYNTTSNSSDYSDDSDTSCNDTIATNDTSEYTNNYETLLLNELVATNDTSEEDYDDDSDEESLSDDDIKKIVNLLFIKKPWF